MGREETPKTILLPERRVRQGRRGGGKSNDGRNKRYGETSDVNGREVIPTFAAAKAVYNGASVAATRMVGLCLAALTAGGAMLWM